MASGMIGSCTAHQALLHQRPSALLRQHHMLAGKS
jgi:hypothetical protein